MRERFIGLGNTIFDDLVPAQAMARINRDLSKLHDRRIDRKPPVVNRLPRLEDYPLTIIDSVLSINPLNHKEKKALRGWIGNTIGTLNRRRKGGQIPQEAHKRNSEKLKKRLQELQEKRGG